MLLPIVSVIDRALSVRENVERIIADEAKAWHGGCEFSQARGCSAPLGKQMQVSSRSRWHAGERRQHDFFLSERSPDPSWFSLEHLSSSKDNHLKPGGIICTDKGSIHIYCK